MTVIINKDCYNMAQLSDLEFGHKAVIYSYVLTRIKLATICHQEAIITAASRWAVKFLFNRK